MALLQPLLLALALLPALALSQRVVVLGSTGGGFAAALAAARGGASVTLLETAGNGGGTGTHIGGMVTGGLSHTDCGNASVIGGLAREYFERVERQYPNRSVDPGLQPNTGPPCWLFEPHVAERVMWDMLREASVRVVTGLGGIASARVNASGYLASVLTLSGGEFEGDAFIDGSYEGDLLAAAGATVTAGRESAAQYGEAGGGRRPLSPYDSIPRVSPYWPNSSELLPLLYRGFPGNPGDADHKLEAYAYRLCMTRSPAHRVPPPTSPPVGYNASTYELFRRVFAAAPPRALGQAGLFCLGPLPNNYTDCPDAQSGGICKCDMISAGGLGTDFAQGSWGGDDGLGVYWPNASVADRRSAAQAHAAYTLGVIWFLSTDPAVPPAVSAEMRGYGLCADEWADTDPPHFPHQLYVREARRLVGDFVLTQNAPAATFLNRSIGLGSYAYDAHTVQRVAHTEAGSGGGAWAANEGEIMPQPPCYLSRPYRIPYDTLLPQRAQLANVLAAVPVSASHVVFTSLRMEPTWMVMGHAAGAAVALALQGGVSVHDIDVARLQALLVAAGQHIAE